MKIKENDLYWNHCNTLTGVFEWCDGAETSWLVIAHYKDGLLHNEYGPAIDYFTKYKKQWWLDHKLYSEEEWKFRVENLQKVRKMFSK